MKFSLGPYEDQELLQELREVLILFFEGLIQGLGNFNSISQISSRTEDIVKFCLLVSREQENPSGSLIGGVLGIVSDIILAFGNICCIEEVVGLVKIHLNSDCEIVKINAECAISNLSQLA